MAETTAISWTDATLNPWIGCTKISPGCDNCYAAQQDKFRSWTPEGWGGPRKRTSAALWRQPLLWNARPFCECPACGWRGEYRDCGGFNTDCPQCDALVTRVRRRVFCASLADVFDNQVPQEWRDDLFRLIEQTPNLDWLLLTKRIGNVVHQLRPRWLNSPPANVWLGATIVNQEEADRDIPKLLATPARVRFLSCEPLLGPVDLESITVRRAVGDEVFSALRFDGDADDEPELGTATLDWVIVGGESGPGARPMHPDWARSLRDQCAAAGVPFHFKQWGEWASTWHARIDPELAEGKPYVHVTPMCRENGTNDSAPNYQLDRVGKKAAGRLLDGVEHNGFPEAP
jgi:protein gp37